jgi:hypothetical protein
MNEIRCIMCGKPAKFVKWDECSAPSSIIYGFCSKTCIANKTIKHRKLKLRSNT